MPLQHQGCAGGVVDLDVVVQVAVVVLLAVGEVFAADCLATLTTEAGVVCSKLESIFTRARYFGNIVCN